MRIDSFSLAGYLSVALWLLVPVLWALHGRRRSRRWCCHVALALACLAYPLAKINSVAHVGRIQLDQSADVAAAQGRLLAARQAAEQARLGEVAQVRFAEDAAGDSLDKGGMDAADLKYMAKIGADATPAWRQEKRRRSSDGPDDSLETAIGAGEPETGAAANFAADTERPPLLMPASDRDRANRLDGINLLIVRLLLLAAAGMVVADYLSRANRHGEAYLPLPLPSSWVNACTPLPPVVVLPRTTRRTRVEELAWFARRGDAFVYCTDDPTAAAAVPGRLARLPRGGWPMDVLHVRAGDPVTDSRFVFEALWYNRASFVVDSAAYAETLLASVVELLRQRRETRARVRQSVHVVWDAAGAMPEAVRAELLPLAAATGWSVMERSTAVGSNRQQSVAIDSNR